MASQRNAELWQEAQSCPSPSQAQASHRALRFGDSPSSHLLFTLPQELLKPRYYLIFLPPPLNSEPDSDFTTRQPSQHITMHLSHW